MRSLDITLVMCTCRRLAYFRRTVASLRANLLEFGILKRVLVIDDNSTQADRDSMAADHSDFGFLLKGPQDIGHARSLNLMLSEVTTEYALYWEDDSLLTTRGAWLQPAIQLMEADQQLLSVSFDRCIEDDVRCQLRRQWNRIERPVPHLRSVHRPFEEYADAREFDFLHDPWPGFSLKPNLLHMGRARDRIGPFDESNKDHMEYDFSLRAVGCNLHTALLLGPIVEDIGDANSAYVLNGMARSYDSVNA